MGKERKRETILKTDQRNLYPQLGLQGNSVKSSGWGENRVLLEGDVLEVSVNSAAGFQPTSRRSPRHHRRPWSSTIFPTE
jgi:hypothetical protein